MIRKILSIFLLLVMLISSTICVYADEVNTEDLVHIVSPEVGASGKTILNSDLFISLYIETEEPLFLSLKKVMPTLAFEEDLAPIELIPLEPALSFEEEEVVEEKVPLAEVVEVAPLTKAEIVQTYQSIEAELAVIETSLKDARINADKVKALIDETAETFDPEYIMTDDDQAAIKFYDDISILYQETLVRFEQNKIKYDELFVKDVFEQQAIEFDSEFPYYEYTVSNIEPGNYKLIITNLDGDEVKKLEFEVVTEDVIAEVITETTNIFEEIIDSNVFEERE